MFSEGNRIGEERADPPYFTGGGCPAGRRCRFSDSAFVGYSSASLRGRTIARPTGNGSITISSSNPNFQILNETAVPLSGDILDKVGRTTGWTTGRVTGTCISVNATDTDITLLCQNRVSRISGTGRLTDNGDSGSPVFRRQANQVDVRLCGVRWGGPDDGSSFVFSSVATIEQELGPLTRMFPVPQPPMCPRGHRCCELDANNTCRLCIPANRSCP